MSKDDGEAKPPMARGGRRRQKLDKDKYPEQRKRGLKPWKAGAPSPNPGGRPRSYKESIDLFRSHMEEIDGYILELARRGSKQGGLTKAEEGWSKHLFQIKEFSFGRNPQNVVIGGSLDVTGDAGDGSGMSMLLQRARFEQAKSRARLIPVEPSKPLAPDDVIVVDTNGAAGLAAVEPEPASAPADTVTSAAPVPSASTVAEDPPPPPQAPEPPPQAAEPRLKPEPPYQGKDVTPKPKSKWNGAPAGFREAMERKDGEFLSAAQTNKRDAEMVKRQEEARRQGRPGGVIPMSELSPDPRPAPEFPNFTLAGNGRIKRC